VFRWHHGAALPVRNLRADRAMVRHHTDIQDQVRDVRSLMDRLVVAQVRAAAARRDCTT
jgi:hypothetical protein